MILLELLLSSLPLLAFQLQREQPQQLEHLPFSPPLLASLHQREQHQQEQPRRERLQQQALLPSSLPQLLPLPWVPQLLAMPPLWFPQLLELLLSFPPQQVQIQLVQPQQLAPQLWSLQQRVLLPSFLPLQASQLQRE